MKMMKRGGTSLRRFMRRYRLGITVILVTTIGSAGFTGWYGYTKHLEAAEVLQKTQKTSERLDIYITEQKAAKEKARLEALAKAAASEAAEQARTASETGAANINSQACNLSKKHASPASVEVVVNKKHCMQPLTYTPTDLQTANGATLSAKALSAYTQLFTAAAAAGQGFYTTSSYRSYADQVSTYNYWVSVSGPDGADTYSARPGYSEHQTGLAFDVAAHNCVLDCFGSTSQYQWLQQNAAKYGFIQRYYAGYESITGYKAEEWHYRYVGVAVAKDMQAKGIKTLEQYWNIPGGSY